tara:strand:+ start:1765 stop:2352 length:588 start_codon:yes stop_codon:yes gene_type:complete
MNKKDILIVCALEIETKDKLDDWNIIYTGVGKVNATYELTAEIFFQKKISHLPKLVINIGTAGSRDIPIHTLVDCTKFIQRDMDKTALGFVRGETAFETNVPMILDFSYVDNPIGKNYVCGTGDNFVQDISKEIEHIDVFDMEAYALAKTCWKNGMDFVSYKYITDNANEKSTNEWLDNCSKGISEFKNILKCYV